MTLEVLNSKGYILLKHRSTGDKFYLGDTVLGPTRAAFKRAREAKDYGERVNKRYKRLLFASLMHEDCQDEDK